jgi:hypothetical protein
MGVRSVRCELHNGGGGATHYRALADPRGTLAVLVAGYVGERVLYGVEGLARDDRRRVQELLAEFPECRRGTLLREAERTAEESLRERWPLVAAIADHLEAERAWPHTS